jgi:hypothetical protein
VGAEYVVAQLPGANIPGQWLRAPRCHVNTRCHHHKAQYTSQEMRPQPNDPLSLRMLSGVGALLPAALPTQPLLLCPVALLPTPTEPWVQCLAHALVATQ